MLTFSSGIPTPDYFNSTCGIPVNQYFWLNSLHPTYPMHDVLAQQVSLQLAAGPNVC
jgi:phospholipase/lecithinase/hemolysin